MVQKKIIFTRDYIISYLKGRAIDGILKELSVPKTIGTIISIFNNLDRFSFFQLAISKFGVYKYVAYCIYFLFIA